jgi:hypothetical protein
MNAYKELIMSTLTPEDTHLKELFKQAMLELFQEQRELFMELFAEVVEDMALANAIREGETTEPASRAEVFQILDGAD